MNHVKKEVQLQIQTRYNKNFTVFFTQLYVPTTKEKRGNTYNVILGRSNNEFTKEKALLKMNYLNEEINKGNYDYKNILLQYESTKNHEKPNKNGLTLEEIGELYFTRYLDTIKNSFFIEYINRFDFKELDDVLTNQLFINKMKSSRTYCNYFKNHVVVKEWILEQHYTKRDNKPKKKLTKIGIKSKTDLSQMLINDIDENQLDDWIQKIKNKTNIGEKSKFNIITQLKGIFSFAKKKKYLLDNPFQYIEIARLQRNPKNVREKTLSIKESKVIFGKFYEKKGLNSFHASLLGLCTGSRVEGILNIRKSDFRLNYDIERFEPRYYTIQLFNFKTRKKYEVPLPTNVGEYFFLLLHKDYKDNEYILRAINPKQRKIKSFAELPKDFKDICNQYLNATAEMKIYYDFIEDDKETIEQIECASAFLEESHMGQQILIKRKEVIKFNKEKINELRLDYLSLKNHDNYLKTNFSFHNFRHTLATELTKTSPFIATKFLNHSADKLNMSQQTFEYAKADMESMKLVVDVTLEKFLTFLDIKVKHLKEELKESPFDIERKLFYKNKGEYSSMDRTQEIIKTKKINMFEVVKGEAEFLELVNSLKSDDEKFKELLELENI